MTESPGVRSLVALGFSEVEAEVYAFLLQEAPATGYRVAQALNRLPPIIYKALESLEFKGAVLAEKAATRMFTPVSPDELLGAMKDQFAEREAVARSALSQIKGDKTDHRVYQLRERRQVMERCRSMLRNCKKVALVDAFPQSVASLKKELEAAAGRGVEVVAKVYDDAKLGKVHTVINPNPENMLKKFNGQLLICATDGLEFLIAFMTPDGKSVYHSVYTASPTIAFVYHQAMVSDIALCDLYSVLKGVESMSQIDDLTKPLDGSMPARKMKKHGDFTSDYNKLYYGVPGHKKVIDEFQQVG